ncbi:MAG: cupin domain-containing protein [Acidimicrobiales bacterium]|nr:cupin domain-containing protein [Acidimicrobiales bacterium]
MAPADVTGAEVTQADVTDVGHDILASSWGERGFHVLDPDTMPWRPPAVRPVLGQQPVPPDQDTRPRDPVNVEEKFLMYPLPGEDRFPVSIVKFPPNYSFPRHWHTDGEFIMVLAGSMMLAGRPAGPGTMAYNDARTVYGAEAAGEEGCEFLMIRRAWAENHIVRDGDTVPDDVIDTGGDEVAAARGQRGLHLFDLDHLPWTQPLVRPVEGREPVMPEEDSRPLEDGGVWEKALVYPLPGEDRFPISIVKFPPHYSFPRHWHTDGEFIRILSGSAHFAGRDLGPGAMAYNDARTVYGAEAAGPEGCEFLMIRRAWAVTTIVA